MKEEKKLKQDQAMQEWLEWTELRDKAQRTKFDYQERWHGWRSPVGLGIGFALFSLSVMLLSSAVQLFAGN